MSGLPGIRLHLLVVALLGLAAAPLSAQPPAAAPPFLAVLFSADLEDESLAAFTGEGWFITAEASGNHIACLNNRYGTYGNWPKLIFGSPEWANYALEVRVRFLPLPDEPGHFALLTRLDDQWWGFRHSLAFNPAWTSFGTYWYGGKDGKNSQSFSSALLPPLERGIWYTVRAELDRARVRTLVNGELVIDYNLTHSRAGFAGLEVGRGVYVCFDDLVVRSLERTPAAIAAAPRAVIQRDANMRLRPDITSARIATAAAGEELFLLGWNADRSWAYLRKRQSSVQGWVRADRLVEVPLSS